MCAQRRRAGRSAKTYRSDPPEPGSEMVKLGLNRGGPFADHVNFVVHVSDVRFEAGDASFEFNGLGVGKLVRRGRCYAVAVGTSPRGHVARAYQIVTELSLASNVELEQIASSSSLASRFELIRVPSPVSTRRADRGEAIVDAR